MTETSTATHKWQLISARCLVGVKDMKTERT